MKDLAANKKAFYDFEVLEKYCAGIVLTGQEVKSVKKGKMNLKGSYVTLRQGASRRLPEIFLINANIPPYQPANLHAEYDPLRPRKMLLNKKEIKYLTGSLAQKGLTLVPIRVYTKHRLIKVEFAKARGKRKVDKRESIKKRDTDKKIRAMLRQKI